MVIRSLVIAAMFAGAASAHAAPTSSTAGMLGGWTLQSGSVSVVGALNSIDAIVASGNWAAFSQAWSMHTSLSAGGSGSSAVLFSPSAMGGMSGFGGGAAPAAGGAAPVVGGASGGGAGVGGGAGAGAGGGAGGGVGIGGGAGGGIGIGGDLGGGGGIGGGIGGGTDLTVPGIGAGVDLDITVGNGNDNGGGGAAEIPEPGSIALLLAGLAGAGFASRRRSR